ncbi:MAG: substrate-binding domain-containing protein, partial [Muribaculaceae bacterium]|nr:substrate-binding domain-containing protein [Muribaculaceae bacterium]
MKNLLQCITIIIMMTVVVGCSEQHSYRIGVSQCSDDDWRAKMNREITSEVLFHPEATVEIRSGDDSNEKQIADIRYFIDNDFDVIIAAPNEADAITPIIKEAYDRGIPVIVFDRNVNGSDYTAFQGADNAGLGKSAGEYARHLTGPGASMIEIYGLAGSTPAIGRHNGFEAALAAAGEKITASAYGNWNYDDARRVTDSLLSIYPDVDIIYAHNDRMAIAASDAARARGLHPKVIGIDAAPEIGLQAVADSVIDATFLYPTEGHLLIRTAMKILREEPYDTILTLPVSSPVDRSNADILLLQSQSIKEESSKIALLKEQLDEFWERHNAQSSLFYATVTIVILLFVVLVMLLRAYWQRKKYQNNLLKQNRLLEEQRNLQQQLNEQLTSATQSKLMFFTNASHDLRTPLT